MRRLGGPGRPTARPHHRAPPQCPGPGPRRYRRDRLRGQGPSARLGPGRVPAGGTGGRVPPRLPLRVPGVGLRPAGGRGQALGAVLHPAQDHGRSPRPVPAQREPGGVRRPAGDGRLDRGAHGPAVARADAERAQGRVRRHERRPRPAPPGDRRPGAPAHRAPLRPRRALRAARRRARRTRRAARQHGDRQGGRCRTGLRGHRRPTLPGHRRHLLDHRRTPPLVRHRRQLQPGTLRAAGRDREPPLGGHLRELQQLQHAQARPGPLPPRPGAHGVPGPLRVDAVQPDARPSRTPTRRTASSPTTPGCGRARGANRRAASARPPAATAGTTTTSPATTARAWRRTPSSPTPSTSAPPAPAGPHFTSTCSSPPKCAGTTWG